MLRPDIPKGRDLFGCSVRNCDEKIVLGGKSETEGKERAKRGQRSKG